MEALFSYWMYLFIAILVSTVALVYLVTGIVHLKSDLLCFGIPIGLLMLGMVWSPIFSHKLFIVGPVISISAGLLYFLALICFPLFGRYRRKAPINPIHSDPDPDGGVQKE